MPVAVEEVNRHKVRVKATCNPLLRIIIRQDSYSIYNIQIAH